MLFALQPSNAVLRARCAAKRPAAVYLTLFKLIVSQLQRKDIVAVISPIHGSFIYTALYLQDLSHDNEKYITVQ